MEIINSASERDVAPGAIGVMRMLCERSLELDNDVFTCFVDFEKAFDRVDWVKMMDILKKMEWIGEIEG